MRPSRRPLVAAGVLLAGLLASGLPTRGCIVCIPAALETVLVSELEGDKQLLIAAPERGTVETRYRIVRVLRGPTSLQAGATVTASLPAFSEDRGKVALGPVLLTREPGEEAWTIRAPADEVHAAFFDKVLTLPAADSDDVLDGLNRALFFLRHLHHDDPVLARTAAAELARLPYPMQKKVRPRLDREKIRAELRDPAALDRRPLNLTLLGICGNEEDAAFIEQIATSMWQRKSGKQLAAVLTAQMELGGESALETIEERYFRDRGRTYAEIEQAILALRIHGNAHDTIKRARVIASYRTLFDDREPLVSLIIPDLIRWQDWESRERIVELAARRGADFPDLQRQADAYLAVHPGRSAQRSTVER